MPVAVSDYSHVRLTVRDIATSRRFYDQVFGFDVAYEVPADADEQTRRELWWVFGGVVYQFPGGLFGLRPMAPADDTFDANRVGLDHLSFSVDSYAGLEDAVAVLDGLGVAHEPIKDIGGMAILEFRDPDGVALELTGPAQS